MKPSMKPSKDIRSEHEPPIRRHTGAAAATSLGRLVTEAALQRRLEDTQRSVEQNAMKAAALRPILDLIHADDAAAEAADRLRKMMRQFPPRTQRLASGAGASPPQPASVTIGPGVTVFTHPYDHAQVGPDTAVNEHSSSAQVLSGTLHVDGWAVDFLEWDGGFFAIAGLGLDLETRRDGTLEVRPVALTSFSAFARGIWLDASVEGHITTTVLNTATQTHVAPPTDYRLFAQHSDGDVSDSLNLGGGYLAVKFQARAKTAYQVWMTASVWGNQSGWSRPFSGSGAGGTIDVSIPIVTAELH